ncbi:hypothetical protein [Kingella oralis]
MATSRRRSILNFRLPSHHRQPENLQHANHPIAAPQSIRPAH